MEYTGYVQGEVIVLKEPLPVPDGTKVRLVLPKARRKMPGQKEVPAGARVFVAPHSGSPALRRPSRYRSMSR